MKALALLLLSVTVYFTVVLGMPQLVQDAAQSPVIPQEDNSPVVGEWVPVQGHVIVEEFLPGIQVKPVIKVEPDVKPEVESQGKEEVLKVPNVKVKSYIKVEEHVKVEPEVEGEPEVETRMDQMLEDVRVKPDVERETQFEKRIDQMVEDVMELEAEGEPQVETNMDQMLEDVVEPDVDGKAQFETHMERMQEAVGHPDFEEDKLAMEGGYTPIEEPVMELEPQAEDVMTEKQLIQAEMETEELSVSAAFGLDGKPLEPLPQERIEERETTMGEQPITELKPEDPPLMSDSSIVEEDLVSEDMGEQRPLVDEEDFPAQVPERESMMGEYPILDGRSNIGVGPQRQNRALVDMGEDTLQQEKASRWTACTGVVLEGKCYQFFKGPKRAVDAEYFCQDNYPNGHLASITSRHIHMRLMDLMLHENGKYTRTWVGGLRYLETGRFIWLDGSRWSYDDWLPGEPNHTANVEHCVELLAVGNGKFNDMPCWDLRAFICSFPYL